MQEKQQVEAKQQQKEWEFAIVRKKELDEFNTVKILFSERVKEETSAKKGGWQWISVCFSIS